MITLRKAADRVMRTTVGCKLAQFFFADYHDSAHVRFGSLRVINEDTVQAGMAFRHIAIVTWKYSVMC